MRSTPDSPPSSLRRAAGAAACGGLLLGSLGAAAAHPRASAPEYRITAVRARLLNANTGVLTRDVLAEPRPALWNTIIGEGEAGGPASSVLVTVEIAGEAGSWEDGRRVELVARTDEREILRHAAELHVMSVQGRTYAGFWLDGVGCEPVRLQARLTGQQRPSTRTAEIPFECGE